MASTGFGEWNGRALAKPNFGAFLSYGFRPFFLGAALYAVMLMTVWLIWIAGVSHGYSADWLPVLSSPFAWHAHELVFGFAVAAVAGFLLTAVPNWTGALPVSGMPLAVLFCIWLAGRVTMMLSVAFPAWVPAAVDLVFLPALASVAARQLFVKPSLRNSVFLLLLAVMITGNVLYHGRASGIISVDPLLGPHLGLWTLVVMLTIIGGRVIPSFTHNWININASGSPFPKRIGKLDSLSVGLVVLTGLTFLFELPSILVVPIALAAAACNGVRLWLWRGIAARKEPIVWILHVAYFWIICGLVLIAASQLTVAVAPSLAYHAFGAGAAGTMILAIMTRASLGHTGRPIRAARPIVAAYVCVTLAAAVRVFVPLVLPQAAHLALTFAAFAWIAAYAIFLLVYSVILTTPRVHMKTSGG